MVSVSAPSARIARRISTVPVDAGDAERMLFDLGLPGNTQENELSGPRGLHDACRNEPEIQYS
jgi:hypothetical protein